MSVRVLISFLILSVALCSITIMFYTFFLSATTNSATAPPPLKYKLTHNKRYSSKSYQVIDNTEMRSKFQNLKTHRCVNSRATLSELNINNKYWQNVWSTKIYLYSAFYDVRYRYEGENYHFVRIIATSQGLIDTQTNGSLFCHLWYDDHPLATIVQADLKEIWIQQFDRLPPRDTYHSYLISCPVPRPYNTHPSHVSVSQEACSPLSTFLAVQEEGLKERRRGFVKEPYVVCVKGMNFHDDISYRLIEWIELTILLGASCIDFYVYSINDNVRNVLNYYDSIGRANIINITLPGDQPNDSIYRSVYLKENLWQKRRNELVTYNDCLYRNMYLYNFIVPIDIDEVLVPVNVYTWSEMFKILFKEKPDLLTKFSSISVPNVYFFTKFHETLPTPVAPSDSVTDEIGEPIVLHTNPENINNKIASIEKHKYHILKHLIRSANFSQAGHNVKSFIATKTTLLSFNHYALKALLPNMFDNFVLSSNIMQLNHYQEKCSRYILSQCVNNFDRYTTKDDIILKYEQELTHRVDKAHLNVKNYLALSS